MRVLTDLAVETRPCERMPVAVEVQFEEAFLGEPEERDKMLMAIMPKRRKAPGGIRLSLHVIN